MSLCGGIAIMVRLALLVISGFQWVSLLGYKVCVKRTYLDTVMRELGISLKNKDFS